MHRHIQSRAPQGRAPAKPTLTPASNPAVYGDGNFALSTSEADASLTVGAGNSTLLATGARATITAGDGDHRITATAGGATVTAGVGDQSILLRGTGNTVVVGGNAGGARDLTVIDAGSGGATVTGGAGNYLVRAAGGGNTVTLGDGRGAVSVSGVGNTVTTGAGTHVIETRDPTSLVTADNIHLGGGTNLVFLGGSGNTVYTGGGTDTIVSRGGDDTFVVAAGGTETIAGFSSADGDALDLGRVLAGAGVAEDLSNLSDFVTLALQEDTRRPEWTDAVLTVTGDAGTASITLLNTGAITLSDLVGQDSILVTQV